MSPYNQGYFAQLGMLRGSSSLGCPYKGNDRLDWFDGVKSARKEQAADAQAHADECFPTDYFPGRSGRAS